MAATVMRSSPSVAEHGTEGESLGEVIDVIVY